MNAGDDDDNVVHLPPHGKAPTVSASMLPCMRCKTPTPQAMLSQYGARCWRCYRSYCEEPQPPARAPVRKPVHGALFPPDETTEPTP